MAFTGPFCKDCRHHVVEPPYAGSVDVVFGGTCLVEIPDFTQGLHPRKEAAQSAYMMRMNGPCSFKGYLFEPKPKEG